MTDKAILVAVDTGRNDDFEYKLDEMENLINACDMEVMAVSVQPLSNPNPATYVGKGKLIELATLCETVQAEYVIFADTLSPAQLKNIADSINAVIMDRTGLILEIFAKRAGTREARLQVESANLHYMLPRLIGMRTSLGRQGGTSGSMSNRGQGEKQLELDRRHIEKKIHELDKELESIEHDRLIQRSARNNSNIPSVALVGYTNAGKSTLMNCLLSSNDVNEDKKVFEKDMLFATLDTTVRKIVQDDKKDFLLSDTVGFVSELPHSLIKAFRSTLDEARYSDLLLIVLDCTDRHMHEQKEITENTLKELGCLDIPHIYVMNKCDRLDIIPSVESWNEDTVYISAANGLNINLLLEKIKSIIYQDNEYIDILIPYDKGNVLNMLINNSSIISSEYENNGTRIVADAPKWLVGKIKTLLY